MIKKLLRKIRPNPLDAKLKNLISGNGKNILIEWNRGLGDIALGLYAIVKRINQFIPNANITFMTRSDLEAGFSLLENIKIITCPFWERDGKYCAKDALKILKLDANEYDLIIQKPDPTYWVKWQLNSLVPKLKWNKKYENLYEKFSIDLSKRIIAIQPDIGTNYNLWRTLDQVKWQNLINKLEENLDTQILLVGNKESKLNGKNVLDLRSKTSLFDLLSILKNVCKASIFLDGGILSLIYFLDEVFDLKIISLWGDPRQGVLKQNVASPNPKLIHIPIIGDFKNVNSISIDQILEKI
jgi:ADP-heptose:LPS heptosyltransferase